MKFQLFLFVFVYLLQLQLGSGFTHLRITESGRIEYTSNSVFALLRPNDLSSFMKQAERLNQINLLEEKVNGKGLQYKHKIKKNSENLANNYQENFYKSDADCLLAGQPLTKLSYFESHIINWHKYGFHMPKESIEISKDQVKNYKKPFCDATVLPFSMKTFDHLESIQDMHIISVKADIDLAAKSLIEEEDFYGHKVNRALQENATSWIFLTMAADYFRMKGDFLNAVKCLQRAVYYAPIQYAHISHFNFANFLQKSHYLNDSLSIALAANGYQPNDSQICYFIGDTYVSLNQIELAYYWYDKSTSIDPHFKDAMQKKHAVACHMKLEKFLEEQYIKLQKKMEDLLCRQQNSKELISLNEKLFLDMSSLDRKIHTIKAYQKFLDTKSIVCDWSSSTEMSLSCKNLSIHFTNFPFNNQTSLFEYCKLSENGCKIKSISENSEKEAEDFYESLTGSMTLISESSIDQVYADEEKKKSAPMTNDNILDQIMVEKMVSNRIITPEFNENLDL